MSRLALALASCTSTLAVEVHDTRREPAEVLAEACDLLGVSCVEASDARHVLVLVERCSATACGKNWRQRCDGWAFAEGEPLTVAHELGHLLGLDHVDDPRNLMHGGVLSGSELTDDQHDQIAAGVARLERCP